MKKTAFIGHRLVFQSTLKDQLTTAIERQIQSGCNCFTMGTHGEFDKLALDTCLQLKRKYPDILIELVLTSLNSLEYITPCADVKTVMYEIETAHYKRQIILSNRLMIDTCDTLICYVNENAYRSGAKTAMRYAMKKQLNIINLADKNSALIKK